MIVAAIRAIPNAKRKVKTNKTGIHKNSIQTNHSRCKETDNISFQPAQNLKAKIKDVHIIKVKG